MRAAPVALAILLAVAARAAAEPQPLGIEVAPFPTPVKPLSGNGVAEVEVHVPCAGIGDERGAAVNLTASGAPSYVVATLSPAALVVPPCEAGFATATASLVVTTTADAPAFRATQFNVTATSAGFASATATAVVVPGYFSILGADVEDPIRVVPPGAETVFRVNVTNLGNGATRVSFEVTEARAGGLVVAFPQPTIIGARQEGDADVGRTMEVRVTTPEEGFYANDPETVNFRVHGAHALTGESGESVSISFLVTTKGLAVPAAAPLALALALALALGIVRHVQKGRRE